ncbi:MAG: glycosyltransferase, partial [Candidatus Hydrogenedentota bacterium]
WGMRSKGHEVAVEARRPGDPAAWEAGRLKDFDPPLSVGYPRGKAGLYGVREALLRSSSVFPGRRPGAIAKQVRAALRVSELASRIARHEYDVLINHFGYDNAVSSAIASRRLGRPFLLWMHGSDFYTVPHRSIRWIDAQCAGVVVTTAYAQDYVRSLGVKSPILQSNLGIDLDFFQPSANVEKEDKPTLVTVARLGHNKAHRTLLRVFARVAQAESAAQLWLVGDGPNWGELEAYARELGVRDNIVFCGKLPREDVRERLQRAWIKALFSEKEGLGLAFMEAMAMGLPCVASKIGGIPEVVVDGETGFLVDWTMEEPEKIGAERILSLLRDERLRSDMASRAIQEARDRFDERMHIERLDGLARRIVTDHKG